MLYTGIGFDCHKYSKENGMYLGLQFFEDECKFEADSDGDIIIHAITNSVLSALNKGDLGSFIGIGVSISGKEILSKLNDLILLENARINNISVQFIGNKPKISPIREIIEKDLSRILNTRVSISSSTTDGLGFTGRGEGACCFANCLIEVK